MNVHIVAIYRVIACLFLWGLTIYMLVQSPLLSFVYFTKWGVLVTTITYTFLCAFHVRQYVCLRTKESLLKNYRNFYSPWLLWKWAIISYESAFTFEVVIVLFYWAVLYPDQDHTEEGFYVNNVLLHAMPMIILLIDYGINRVPFKMVHLPVSIFLMLAYGIVNLSYTISTGTPVYPPLNFKDAMSYVWIVVLALLETATYLLM